MNHFDGKVPCLRVKQCLSSDGIFCCLLVVEATKCILDRSSTWLQFHLDFSLASIPLDSYTCCTPPFGWTWLATCCTITCMEPLQPCPKVWKMENIGPRFTLASISQCTRRIRQRVVTAPFRRRSALAMTWFTPVRTAVSMGVAVLVHAASRTAECAWGTSRLWRMPSAKARRSKHTERS